jgi:hypothetical protein
MPAQRLESSPTRVHPYCVVGTYLGRQDGKVRHVGLLSPGGNGQIGQLTLQYNAAFAMDHIVMSDASRRVAHPVRAHLMLGHSFNEGLAHVVGWVTSSLDEHLEDDDVKIITGFLHANKYETLFYIAHPPRLRIDDETEDRPKYHYGMSCVGLVLEAYEAVGRCLLVSADDATENYPTITRQQLEEIYPMLVGLPKHQMLAIGLDPSQNSWRVVLPGYLFHALSRGSGDWPYKPKAVEEAIFP